MATDGGIAGKPSAYCTNLALFLETDDELRRATAELSGDPRVREVRGRTKAESYEDFKRIFASQPDLVEKARPEAIPATLQIVEAIGVDGKALAEELKPKYGKDVQYTNLCEAVARYSVPTS